MKGVITMNIKRTKNKIFGASLTAAEKKAMDIEIKRQLADYSRKHIDEIDSMILWNLHEIFGFGTKRLKRFYDGFHVEMDALINRYELDGSDQAWLCSEKLKNLGIDINDWRSKQGGDANANDRKHSYPHAK